MTFDIAAAQWHPVTALVLEFGYSLRAIEHFNATH